MLCDMRPIAEADENGVRSYACPTCGRGPYKSRTGKFREECRKRGLGDLVADAIQAVTFGAVKPCGGCKQRQAALNEIGRKITG